MALWGKTDTLASSPKWVARKATFNSASTSVVNATDNTINLIPSNTGFNTGDEVYYSINGGTVIGGLTDATTYYVRVVGAGIIELYDTYAHAIAAEPTKTGRLDISGVGVGSQTLQRTGASNPFGDHIYNGTALVFADVNEVQQAETRAKGIKTPGWWLYRTGTNASDSSVYHHAECLIALGGQSDKLQATTGDREDAITIDGTITISAQPTSTSVPTPTTATFTVTASIAGAGTLAYQWQKQESTESGTTWTNVGTNSNSYTTGATAVAPGSGATNGDKYRVIVSATGSTSVTSSVAVLTVTS